MRRSPLHITEFSEGRLTGPSPAENRYYVLVLFDISDSKKYRLLVRLLKRYSSRIQKSVFEAHLKLAQIRELMEGIEDLMASELCFNPEDNVRLYRIALNGDVTVFGT